MTVARRGVFGDIVCNVMVFAVLVCPVAFFAYLRTGGVSAAWLCLLLLPVFMLFYTVRLKIKSFWIFLALHAVMPMLPFVIFRGDILLAALFSAFMLAGAIYSFNVKYKGEPQYVGHFFFLGTALCVLKTFAAPRLGMDGLTGLSAVLILVLASGYLIIRNMKQLDASLAVFSTRANTNDGHILRFNNFLLAGFVIFTAGIAGASLAVFSENGRRALNSALAAVQRAFEWLLRVIFALLIRLFPPEDSVGSVTPPPPAAQPDNPLLPGLELPAPPPEPSYIADAVLRAAAALIIGGGAIYLVYAVLKRLYGNFRPAETGDVEEKLDREGRVGRALRRLSARDFGRGEERRIRKRYYKAVVRQKELKPQSTDTTGDILRRSKADMAELTQEYERVRYHSAAHVLGPTMPSTTSPLER